MTFNHQLDPISFWLTKPTFCSTKRRMPAADPNASHAMRNAWLFGALPESTFHKAGLEMWRRHLLADAGIEKKLLNC